MSVLQPRRAEDLVFWLSVSAGGAFGFLLLSLIFRQPFGIDILSLIVIVHVAMIAFPIAARHHRNPRASTGSGTLKASFPGYLLGVGLAVAVWFR